MTSTLSRAQKYLVGGVNSPVRAFTAVNDTPLIAAHAHGPFLYDEQGTEYIDLCMSWGPLILGHAHPAVVEAITETTARGTTFGMTSRPEVELAEIICAAAPCIEKMRLTSSGTEAVMTAVRLARGVTNRTKILLFDGGYHGHADGLLATGGSGMMTHALLASPGIPSEISQHILMAPYNDCAAVDALLSAHGDSLAAIVVEPIAGNMGLVLPDKNFLAHLRMRCDDAGALLIFDEVITGFRFAPTTYGTLCGVAPDITCLGKIIGGGMPLAALGGRAEIMRHLAPEGPIYHAGTLSGNPVAAAAGCATLRELIATNLYPALARRTERIAQAFNDAARANGMSFYCAHYGSAFTPFFCEAPVRNRADAMRADRARFAQLFRAMRKKGVLLPPAQCECAFLSIAHTDEVCDRVIAAVNGVAADAAGRG